MSMTLQPYLECIEQELDGLVRAADSESALLFAMMRYHLGWLDRELRPLQAPSGKRLRPLLCLLCCDAANGNWHNAAPAAAALELIHNFSLVHDDIEDNTLIRRGRDAVWSVWGLAHGVNVGDTLQSLARIALARLADRGLDPETVVRAMRIVDSSCLRLCQGQYMDLAGEGRLDMTENWYMKMIGYKTAVLFSASTQLGALLAGASADVESYRQFGFNLGLAFQMVDDILGIWGVPEVTGKPAASDLFERKMTLPIIFALRSSASSNTLAALYGQDRLSEEDVAQTKDILDRCEARSYVRRKATELEAAALKALEATEAQPPALNQLRDLTEALSTRRS